jgi:hypothetical protein
MVTRPQGLQWSSSWVALVPVGYPEQGREFTAGDSFWRTMKKHQNHFN